MDQLGLPGIFQEGPNYYTLPGGLRWVQSGPVLGGKFSGYLLL